jgi:flavin reductase (DIM6/NTAB) family NADH-FMN oxidoreductase RutF
MFNSTNINSFSNVFVEIGERWMLLTVKDKEKINTMTASWGGLGFLWGMPVAFVFIRPQRFTNELMERAGTFTASFYPEDMRKVLNFCGKNSGRDMDKIAETGLIPIHGENGFVYFEQAEQVFFLRKLYAQHMNADCAVDKELFAKHYPNEDYHYMYVAKIEEYLVRT